MATATTATTSSSPTSATSPTCRSSRCSWRRATRSPRRIRWSRSSPTRRRWTCRRRSAGVVQELKVNVGDTVSEGSRAADADARRAPRPPGGRRGHRAGRQEAAAPSSRPPRRRRAAGAAPPGGARAPAAPAPAAPAARRRGRAGRHRLRQPGRPPPRARARRRPRARSGAPARKGRITKADVEAAKAAPARPPQPRRAGRAAAAPAARRSASCRGRRSTSRSSARSSAQPLSRIKKISGPNLHRNWVMIPHVTHYDEADITELEAFRKQTNEEHAKEGVKVTMVALLVKACVASLQAVPAVQRLARRRRPRPEALLQHRLRGRHAARASSCRSSRTPTRRASLDIARELTRAVRRGARRQAQAGRHAGRHVLDLVPRRHRRHGVHADHQRARGRDPRRREVGDEAGVGRQASSSRALMVPLSLSYDHRVIDGALAARFCAHLARRARRPAAGAARRWPWLTLEISVPDIGDFADVPIIEVIVSPRRHGGARRTRSSRSSPTRRRWTSRRRAAGTVQRAEGRGRRHRLRGHGDPPASRAPPRTAAARRRRRARGGASVAAAGRGVAARPTSRRTAPTRARTSDRGPASRTSATSPTCRSSRSWCRPGDTVAEEDPLITLESDKATMDVPSPAAGTVSELKRSGRRHGLRGHA